MMKMKMIMMVLIHRFLCSVFVCMKGIFYKYHWMWHIQAYQYSCITFSVKGSRRRATKNHKSKAELLNPEEGEGDLAVGKMQTVYLCLSVCLSDAHTYTRTHNQRQPQEHTDCILSCLSALPDPSLLPSPRLCCTSLLLSSTLPHR